MTCIVTNAGTVSVSGPSSFSTSLVAQGTAELFTDGTATREGRALIERGRRETLLRMKEQDAAKGCQTVANVRLETLRTDMGSSDNKGTSGVEILVHDTAV